MTSADEVGVLDKLVGSVHSERVRSGFVGAGRLLVIVALISACGSRAGDAVSTAASVDPTITPVSTSTSTPPSSVSSTPPSSVSATTTIASMIPENPDLTTGMFQVPSGTLQVDVGDLYVVHDDGDLWLHPGLRDGASSMPVRLVDMDDPRVPVTEGEGPNTIEDVAGEVDGVVYFSDCCEPVAGDVRAATGPDMVEALGFGSSVALSPDRTRLATLNSFGLGVMDLTTGTSTFRSFDTGQPFVNPWDVIWSADGRELVVLAFDEDGGALHRFSASESLEPGSVIPIDVGFDPARPPGAQFAGHGPGGEIAVAFYDGDRTRIVYFDPAVLSEIPTMERDLPTGVTSVRLDSDGVGLLWIDDGTLWWLPADGIVGDLGDGFVGAWFAP